MARPPRSPRSASRRSSPSHPDGSAPGKGRPGRDTCLLLVDSEERIFEQLSAAVRDESVTIIQVDSVTEARRVLARQTIDLAVIEPGLEKAQGMALVKEIGAAQRRSAPRTILLSAQPSMEQAIAAIGAGVSAFMVKPVAADELSRRVHEAIAHSRVDRQTQNRFRRLKRVCRKLDDARKQVTQQVDILCNDLVSAYQELAGQMQQIAQTSEYAAAIDKELDLEQLLRKTLEYLLQKAGPTNAAVFLPSQHDEFTVGAYVNYDTTNDAAQSLLQHLADVVAPRVARRDGLLHVTDNNTLKEWIGDDSAYLADCHVLAFPARQGEETLAVVVLFRDGSEPYDAQAIESCAAVGSMLAEYLTRIIRVHHRHLGDPFEDRDDDEDMGDAEAA